jgi:phospholipid transport system substrate-binding protein
LPILPLITPARDPDSHVFREEPVMKIAIVSLLVTVLFAPVTLASAGEPTEQLKRQVDEVIKTLQSPEFQKEGRTEERRATVKKLAAQIFDFEETARRALGRHWQSRTPAERQEFVRLFSELLEQSYISKIDQYHGEKIAYGAETVEGDQATVKTRIMTPKGSELPVDYRMHRASDRWLVYDVAIEGVSLIANYRTQFNKIIQSGSYEELVQKLKSRAFTPPDARKS